MKSDWSIVRYKAEDARIWDDFVDNSRQGTLLHKRGYMDYHSDRFTDCSLLAYRNGKLTAILPANINGRCLYSHQGLTYGGWLTLKSHFDGSDMLSLFDAWTGWCRMEGISVIYYKAVPHIYHRMPAEEDIYALFRYNAVPWITNLSSTIDMRDVPSFNTLQRRHLKKSSSLDPWVRETSDVAEFMPVLEECLRSRHDSAPVHSASELQMLKDRFPGNIRLFLCGVGDETEAEACIYDTAGVAHCQYIATTETGRENGTLTFLFHHLLTATFASRRYFDYGTSNESGGRVLNPGLIHQKVGLGGRGVAYQSFELKL